MISAYNCGIINGYRELYGSESISQVVLFYLDLIEYSCCELPIYFIYDDACHLRKYISNYDFKDKSIRSKVLFEKHHYIDKFHMHNHVDKWCKANCDPNEIDDLNNVNTVVCEEVNYWLGLNIPLNISILLDIIFFYT